MLSNTPVVKCQLSLEASLSPAELIELATRDVEDMRKIAARICRDYLTGPWKTIAPEEIQLKRISGGLSNFLYHVSLPDKPDNNNEQRTNCVKRLRKNSSSQPKSAPKEVLLRIYGQMHGEQALETVLTDTVVFTLLSERRLGPKLHGIFPGGRIEQYIPARPLNTQELGEPRISAKIAEKMAAIHSLHIPVSKEPEWLWKTMKRWLIKSEEVLATFQSTNDAETKIANTMRAIDFRAEMAWFKQMIEAEDFPVVFSHNDLQEGNILFRETTKSSDITSSTNNLVSFFDDSATTLSPQHIDNIIMPPEDNNEILGDMNELDAMKNSDDDENLMRNLSISARSRKRSFSVNQDEDPDSTRDSVLSDNSQTFCDNFGEPELMIIDFEYCAYNYRGFDLANHFVEWTMDYTNTAFPFFYQRPENFPTKEKQEHFIVSYLRAMSGNEDYVPKESEIEQMLDEVRCFKIASHLFWTLWSIVNVHQEIEFGYWDYAACRLKHYLAAKEDFAKAKGLSFKRKHTLDERQ